LRIQIATFLACILVAVVVLHLNAHLVFSSSTIYIRADGSIDPPTAPISTTNNVTYTLTNNIYDEIVVEKNDIMINGAFYTVQGSGTGNGFYLYSVTNVTLTNVNIKGFAYGVYLESSSYNSILRDNISSNGYDGIEVYFSSDYNNIRENRIEANGWYGVAILFSDNNTVSANNIANNDDGIDAYDASGTEISKNRITDSGEFGIGLYSSSENAIFLNDFINNTQHIYSEYSTNKWDNGYPSGGNYWNDYNGTDSYNGAYQNVTGSDGIGDTEYSIDPDNIDRYPLMNPWINLAVVDILPSKSVVGEGYKVNISVTVQNQGWDAQTTRLTVYVNTTVVATVSSLALPKRSQVVLNFTWQTTPALRGNYTMSSTVDAVPGEPDTTDNNKAYGRIVKVTIVGDVNGDNGVDILDAITISTAFSALPGSSNWNGNADINSDNTVDILDAIILSVNFGRKL
jgi:parallel beta-helix repeat protein